MVNSFLDVTQKKLPTHALMNDRKHDISKSSSMRNRSMDDFSLARIHDQPNDADNLATQSMQDKSAAYLFYAKPALMLMTQIQQSVRMPNIEKIHQQFIEEINLYIQSLEQLECSPFLIDCSAYCLCAAIDETVLATEWGTKSIWVQKSLLSLFRSETLGGERFYIIIEKLCEEPRKHIGVIELIYTILSLGFEGQYYGKDREKRNTIRNHLYQVIYKERGKIIKQLSPHWSDVQTIESRVKRKLVVKRLSLIGVICIIILYVFYSFEIAQVNHSVINRLDRLGNESPITAYSQLINRELFTHHLDVGDDDDV
jgi:type IV/VI secretion system ImpK/VasF family protein